jgi:hypothetical protein
VAGSKIYSNDVYRRLGVLLTDADAVGDSFYTASAPFRTPDYILTHEVREPWERPGGTTFYFVNDGIDVGCRGSGQIQLDAYRRIWDLRSESTRATLGVPPAGPP